jgi:hypothetical protein
VTTICVVGLGAVGSLAARQLAETPGVDRVLLADAHSDRAAAVARAIGERAAVFEWSIGSVIPEGVDAVACAMPAGVEFPLVRMAVDAGLPVSSSVDDHEAIRKLLTLDDDAVRNGSTVLVGCGLAPGVSDVLARHAAGLLDDVEEVHVARVGVAGPASAAVAKHALRDHSLEWRAGAWHDDPHRVGHELIWFPEPIGAHECELVASGIWCLAEAFPDAARISVRLGTVGGGSRVPLARRTDDASWGATRVEVWGRQHERRMSIIYGVVERTAVAAGTTLAVSTLALLGLVPDLDAISVRGVHGLAAVTPPVPFLAELARRGVKAATFEGVA